MALDARLSADGVSLLHGWLPATVQLITGLVLVLALADRNPRWWTVRVPAAAVAGVALAATVHWFMVTYGLTTNRVPVALWIWIALTGFAVALLMAGRSFRRAAAMPLCVLCVLMATNSWVGNFPTVGSVWAQLTNAPLPDEIDGEQLVSRQAARTTTGPGAVLRVDIAASASGFGHRTELVYLPPAWFATVPPPQLPVVLMIPAAFHTPADWIRAGGAVATADAFAAAHDGQAPVLVFPDVGGSFTNDTECVDGPRGNVSAHLTEDVVPYVVSRFGTRPAGWGVVGFSMGGTCAVHLTVRHPELFAAFVDIGGDIAPNVGSDDETIRHLFGGSRQAWSRFDPRQVMTTHGRYTGIAGWFSVIGDHRAEPAAACDAGADPDNQARAAAALCGAATELGIDATVVFAQGKHDWPTAASVFRTALPWLSERFDTADIRAGEPPAPGA